MAVNTSLIVNGFFPAATALRERPVGDGENATEIVRGMTPLGCQPGVIEIQPTDHRADVEGRLYRIELELGAWHFGTIGHHRAWNDGSEQLGASRILQGFESATERIDQTIARRLVGELRADLITRDVIDDVEQDLIGFRSEVGKSRHYVSLLGVTRAAQAGRTSGLRDRCNSRSGE